MNRKDIETYTAQVNHGVIPRIFRTIVDFMEKLKRYFDTVIYDYEVGTITEGFLDYTYFSFSDDFLKSRGLKCLILIDHSVLDIETWIIGKSRRVNDEYIERFSKTPLRDKEDLNSRYAARVIVDDSPLFKTDIEYMAFVVDRATEAAASFKSYIND